MVLNLDRSLLIGVKVMNPEYLSECYIKAYNKAYEMTKNANIAIGAAMAVVNVIAQQSKSQEQLIANPFINLFIDAMLNDKKSNKNKKVNA